ncbi:hypothetical protein ABZ820_04915 [Streptomyces diacarni]|uniref:hypothetical protein n=1 Tax=Streptomyces diacarni TaxID=2800381 RepID=UPI0033D86E8B
MSTEHSSAHLLASSIRRQLAYLAEMLPAASATDFAKALEDILWAEDGILGRTGTLLATASHDTRQQAISGHNHPEVPLAIARAANAVHDLQLELAEYHEDLQELAKPPAESPTPAQPIAAPDATRGRHR